MSSSLDASFNPFALHPFTSGGQSAPTTIPRPPAHSSPYTQALQHQKQSPNGNLFMPQQLGRANPSTPPGGYVPSAPNYYAQQRPQQPQSQAIFTSYIADGRRTPDLDDILVKKSSTAQWSRK